MELMKPKANSVMAIWSLNEKKETPKTFSLSLHPLIAQLLFSRGFSTEKEIQQFISPNYETDSNDPFLFCDMEKVVQRIGQARDKKQIVAISGDYDADGITASIVIKETLDILGVESFVYIPDKRVEGYGMNMEAMSMFKEKNVSLIITVDCGIANIEEVEKANSLGIDVIITDHHYVPSVLPPAYAIINPHSANDSNYPFKDLAGVGVAFKVVQAIYQKFLPEKIGQTKWMLDLVAIGTIADCVAIVGENRLFVKYGLTVLSKTKRLGLKELFTVGRIVINENTLPDTKKVSFYIAPRINAAGRITHANLAYDLIVEKNIVRAREFALELEESNTKRQKITEKMAEEIRILAQNIYKDKKFIFAISEHFSAGVLGLVAGKIAQQFNKPTAVFQKCEDISKGSFRSIPQLNIIETIEECRKLLDKFGGHSQAAGVSVKNENLEKFYEKMDKLIGEKLKGVDLSEKIKIDTDIAAEDIDFELVEGIEKLKPFGEGNREPVFMIKDLIVKEKRIVGNGNKHIKLFLAKADLPKIFEVISFNGYEKYSGITEGNKVDILCNIQKDEWNGNKKIQLTLIDLKIKEK
jgi:single-stranded-DNA-specific exonuclease